MTKTVKTPDPVGPNTAPEAFFLRRLHRLVALTARPDLDPAQRRLLNYACYSTYWDCARLGLRTQACALLQLPHQQVAHHREAEPAGGDEARDS